MKAFLALFGLVSVAMARPSIIQLSPQGAQASAAASASASSSPQRLVQIVPGLSIGPDPRLINTVEVHIANTGREAIRIETNAKNAPAIARIITSPAVAPVGPDGRVVDTIEVSLAKAEHAAAHRNERIRLANQDAQAAAAQAQAQQQILDGPNSWLTSTRQAQSLASINPTGASSISSAQVIESPQINAGRIAQQQAIARQTLRLQSSQPVIVGLNDQIVPVPLIIA